MSFYYFMEQFKNDDSPFGDLASDMEEDNFPKNIDTVKEVREYFNGTNNKSFQVTLEKALEIYSKK